jgi:23S rRNA (adenine2030-N6)-methyltransferase
MNYRHIFHAGNICDVVKHTVLTLMMEYLRSKDKGFCVLDTHAGIGLYDLCDERALKTNEAENGIKALLAAPRLPELAEFYRILGEFNPGWQRDQPDTNGSFQFYPGSPLIARKMMRAQDRLILCELHEEDARPLRRQFRYDAQTHVHERDGYEALQAFLPPDEKRGLALIDPPFEDPDEFDRLIESVKKIHARWQQGTVMIWYPVKERPAIWRFHEALNASGIPKLLAAEFIFEEETRHDRLNGCGLIIMNPPFTLDDKLRTLFPALHTAMKTNFKGSKVDWLTAP